MTLRPTSLAFVAMTLPWILPCIAAPSADFLQVRDRMVESLSSPMTDPASTLATLGADGSFTGVNYEDTLNWKASDHLARTRTLARAAYGAGSPHLAVEGLKPAIARALEYWARGGFKCSANRWHQTIGVPGILSEILVFPIEGLGEGDRAALVRLLDPGMKEFRDPPKDGVRERTVGPTGANLTDILLTAARVAVASGDEAALDRIRDLLENELRVFPEPGEGQDPGDGEGIKADGSFQQHLPLIYNQGYGDVFKNGLEKFFRYFRGTRWEASARAKGALVDMLLDGEVYMVRGGYGDYNVQGRGISRPGNLRFRGRGLASLLKELASDTAMPRRSEIQGVLSNRLGGEDRGFSGHRHFWISDYTAHHRPGYAISLRTVSTRTKPTECINGENLLGRYLAQGVTFFRMAGDEADDLPPFFDWNRLPGTTAIQGRLAPWPVKGAGGTPWGWKGSTAFTGGADDGLRGVSCMDLDYMGVTAKKAWFFFDAGMVALAADLTAEGGGDAVTGINQCHLRGTVEVDRGSGLKPFAGGIETFHPASRVRHGGIDYLFGGGGPVEVMADAVNGSWKSINAGASDAKLRTNVFRLAVNHGPSPKNLAVSYGAFPGLAPDRLADWARQWKARIRSNTADLQAVETPEEKCLMAVFRSKGTVSAASGLEVKVDRPCALVITETPAGLRLAVANPESLGGDLRLEINRALSGEGVTAGEKTSTVAISFGTGTLAGKSVLRDLTPLAFKRP